jgi:hypothetical protein
MTGRLHHVAQSEIKFESACFLSPRPPRRAREASVFLCNIWLESPLVRTIKGAPRTLCVYVCARSSEKRKRDLLQPFYVFCRACFLVFMSTLVYFTLFCVLFGPVLYKPKAVPSTRQSTRAIKWAAMQQLKRDER